MKQKIEIIRVGSDSSRLVNERLNNYETREPNNWKKTTSIMASNYLNEYRLKYDKKAIPDNHIKLNIVCGTDNLSEY